MDRELLRLWRRDSLAKSSNLKDRNRALDTVFVNVVDSFVCDNKSALLGPLEHVSFLYFVCEEKLFSLDQIHQF